MRVNNAGVFGVGYYINTPSISEDPFLVLVTDYDNGGLSLVHKKNFEVSYPDSDPVGYNATFAMPIGAHYYRSVTLNSGMVSTLLPGGVQLGLAKENPGVLLVFYKTAAGEYGVSYTPWGVSALGLEAKFGAPTMDATNVITKTCVINIESFTYYMKVELWTVGR